VQKQLHSLLLLISIWGSFSVFAQENETQLKSKADNLFQNQDYVAATPAFLQLLALQPRSAEYNYKYGTCLVFNGRKKQDAIKYLQFATSTGNVDNEAFYYMGKAFHLNYQFEEAIKFYNLYKNKSAGKTNPELDVDRQIEMCENGRKLLKKLTDIVVLQKKEYAYSEFYNLYDLKDFGGDILVSTADQSKIDKKRNHIPIIHFPPNSKQVFFASYGENEENGKQIYVKKKIGKTWSKPELVQGEINTKYDEDFPYLDPNGEYLYFSSKGHNSMGGYDVFKCKYNAKTGTFGKVENLDFAISSADNDLFYIVDSLGENAWFASSRQSLDGKIQVYKVRVQRISAPIAAIKGSFKSTVNAENKKFNIEVADVASGRNIGTFYSDKEGGYLISLPKGGKYEYSIRIDGSAQVFKATVNIPVLSEFKPLKQMISHLSENSKELVKVIDLFGGNVENADAVMIELLQKKAELNENSSQFDLKAFEAPVGSYEVLKKLGMEKLLPMEAKDKVGGILQLQYVQAKSLEELQQKALAKVITNTAEIKKKQEEFKIKVGQTNLINDPKGQYRILQESDQLSMAITNLEYSNQKLIKFADSLAKPIKDANVEANMAKQVETPLLEVSNDSDIIRVLSDNLTQLLALLKDSGLLPSAQLSADLVQFQTEKEDVQKTLNNYKASESQLKNEVTDLTSKLNSAKSKDKPAIQSSMDAKQSELGLMTQEIQSLEKKIARIEGQATQKEDDLAFVQNIEQGTFPSKAITISEVRATLDKSENQNYKTLKSYVAQQKTELEKNPAIASLGQNQEGPKTNEVIDKKIDVLVELSPKHNEKLTSIENDPKLSPEEKLELSQKEDLALQAKVDKEIQTTENNLTQNPSNAVAKAKLESLKSVKEQVDNRIVDRQIDIETTNETVEEKDYSSDEIVKELKPNLEKRLVEIAKNKDLTALEQMKMAQNEELEFEQIITEQIFDLEDEIKVKPADQSLKTQLKTMQNLKKGVAENIDNRALAIASLDPKSDVITAVPRKETLLKTLKPNQEAAIAAIEANSDMTSKEKIEAVQKEDQILQKNIESEILKLDEAIQKNPADTKAKDDKKILLELQQETQNRIADRKVEIEKLEPVNTIERSDTTEIIALVKPDYVQKIKSIESNDLLSPTEKQGKLIQEEVKLQKVLDEEIKNADKILAINFLDEKTVEKKEQLLFSKEQSQNRVDESKQLLVAEEKNNIKPSILFDKTDKNYALDIQKIENSEGNDKQKQLIEREKTSQELLKAKIEKNEKSLAKKSDPTLEAENQVLNELIDASQKRIENVSVASPISSNITAENIDIEMQKSLQGLQKDNPTVSIYNLESAKDLENRRRKASVEFGELSSEIEKLNADIENSNRRKAKKLKVILAEKQAALVEVQNTVSSIDTELEKRNEKPAVVYKETAINENITYAEELKIASSEEYKTISKLVGASNVLKAKIETQEKQVEQLMQENRLLMLSDLERKTFDNQKAIEVNNKKIIAVNKSIETDKKAYTIQKQEIQKNINGSPNAMKLQNLIARGVQPITELVVAAPSISLPSNGFEIAAEPKIAPMKSAIPIGVGLPAGLVYRVQVGAFAKPIKEELFREFNPVSGEKLESGITRYMAGYFDSRNSVLEARTKIQELGYSDAFPVAYCDGVRIPMFEARQLEESGRCVAKKVEELIAEVAVNVAEMAPKDSTLRVLPSANNLGAYNQAPGAVKAIAVETRLGLFFTVQVGVYNTPVPASQIKNMEPLITKRLPNGQIRYSAGIFQNVEGAQPKKQEAIAKGIIDAYITAYYKGERISLDEAKKLLSQLGNTILEKSETNSNKIIAPEKIQQIAKETQRTLTQQAKNEDKTTMRLQLISKETYENFPKDVLSKYNESGQFFFDETDKKVKSIIYKNMDFMPQIYTFRKDIDTVFIIKNDTLTPAGTLEIKANYPNKQLSGEVGDWLIRLGYQREIFFENNKVQIRIFGIKDQAVFERILKQMTELGFIDLLKK
jgi:hypothetical protein